MRYPETLAIAQGVTETVAKSARAESESQLTRGCYPLLNLVRDYYTFFSSLATATKWVSGKITLELPHAPHRPRGRRANSKPTTPTLSLKGALCALNEQLCLSRARGQ